ncbi:hypothetical protein GQ597_11760 [Gilliamella sp. Pra-s65]|uniref:T6SS effector BTH_I2691 family protein n=1 Tax=unclassified Gilliamella TaxID=2685620 RepID=UPI0013664FCD|nr:MULTISPECIES: T6SS effector BTH_I2691 family protein [unclassified Gilliamella]MWN91369.1 hypothetical protein [Gilliamella sp. Pra-s65]MWP74324.1 hypothetical protein [Gilliamella sp. Pra-s52]
MANLENLVNLILAAKIKQNDSGKRCPKCQEKEGDLIVLPTRLSISGFMGKNKTLKHNLKADVELPPLPDFAQQMVSNLPLEHSKYCVQMLRQGYLYVLEDRNNGEKKWRAFTSSPTGCLVEYSDINTVPNTSPTYSCNIATDGADASYISFKNSKEIFKIHFLFSPNKITNERLEFYQTTPEFELQGVTPDQIRSGQKSIKDDDLLSNILEFSTAMKIAEQESFLHSKSPYDFKTGERDYARQQLQVIQYIYEQRTFFGDKNIMQYYFRYLSLYKTLKERQGAAIVVHDAIGITQSLNKRRYQALEKVMKPWMEGKDNEGISNEHRLIILRQLLGFKESFHQHRIKQIIKQNKNWEKFSSWGNDKITIPSIGDMANNKRREIFQKAEEELLEQQTEELSKEDFKKFYWNRLSQEKMDEFEKEFNELSQSLEELAEKRADDYIKWLKSSQLISALDLYDNTQTIDGIMFQLQMSVCLCGVNSSEKIRQILDEWWLEPQITQANLCMRTYLFNNKNLIDNINEYLDIQQNIAINESSDDNRQMPDVDNAISLLNKLTNHVNQTDRVVEVMAERGFPIALLSVTFADLVRSFLRATTQRFNQTIQNRLGNLILASISTKALEMYESGYSINGHTFRATPRRGAAQITRVARNNFTNADLVNTKIAMMIFAFSGYESAKKLINGQWNNSREFAELTASLMGSTAAGVQILTSAVQCCIENNPNSRTATVTYNAFGRYFLWSASLSLIAGGMSGVLDITDMVKAIKKRSTGIAIAYFARGLATIVLSISQFVVALGTLVPWFNNIITTSIERTIWVSLAEVGLTIGRFAIGAEAAATLACIIFYASVIIIVVSVCFIIIDDNAMQKWFDRCCFSNKPERKKFADLGEELTEWYQALQEIF